MDNEVDPELIKLYILKAKLMGLEVEQRFLPASVRIDYGYKATFRINHVHVILHVSPLRPATIYTLIGYHAEVFEAFLIEIDKSKNPPPPKYI